MRNIPTPPAASMANEMLSWLEIPRLMASAPAWSTLPRAGQESGTVMVLPGFGTGDLSTIPLRSFLGSLGYRVSGWQMGTNTGDVLALIDRMSEQVQDEVESRQGEPVHLVGWSLGGYIAREVARDNPAAVKSVITMGSPVVGGPKYTRVAALFEQMGEDLEEIERLVDARNAVPLRVPVTAIYSKRDGVVAWQACIDEVSDGVEHVEVAASHMGLGISADVYHILAQHLGQHAADQMQ